MSFENKVVIVTGSSSGIGASTAIEFTKQGAQVVLVGRNTNKLNNVAAVCAKYGTTPLILVADVTTDAEKIVSETIAKYGKIDVLINNAGCSELSQFIDDSALQAFDNMINLNLQAVVRLTHVALPHLIKMKGNIVNVSSVAAISPYKYFWAYGVAKAGMDHFSRCIAKETAPYGVRVNVVNPGPVRTDIAENMKLPSADEFFNGLQEQTALKRISDPIEIADIILFLASDKAKGVTGCNWVSDNGVLLLTA